MPDVDWEEQRAVRSRLYQQAHQAFSSDRSAGPLPLDDHFADLDLRSRFIASWETFFREWDVLICPVTNRTAFEHRPMGTPFDVDGISVDYWSIERHVQPFNLIGAPAIALPAGADEDGLPLSVQLVASRWSDDRLLAIAEAVEQVAGGFRPPPGSE